MQHTALNVASKSATSHLIDYLAGVVIDVAAAVAVDGGFQGYDGEENRQAPGKVNKCFSCLKPHNSIRGYHPAPKDWVAVSHKLGQVQRHSTTYTHKHNGNVAAK